jgi:hypothetical protein
MQSVSTRILILAAMMLASWSSWQTDAAAQVAPYTSIRVLSPTNEATIFDNNGVVAVDIELIPALHVNAGHRLRVRVDDTVVAPDRAQLRFQLDNVDRGEHWLRIEVLDAGGNTLITAAPVKFQMWRASAQFPDRKTRRHPL